jgi:hypothetical protein
VLTGLREIEAAYLEKGLETTNVFPWPSWTKHFFEAELLNGFGLTIA